MYCAPYISAALALSYMYKDTVLYLHCVASFVDYRRLLRGSVGLVLVTVLLHTCWALETVTLTTSW